MTDEFRKLRSTVKVLEEAGYDPTQSLVTTVRHLKQRVQSLGGSALVEALRLATSIDRELHSSAQKELAEARGANLEGISVVALGYVPFNAPVGFQTKGRTIESEQPTIPTFGDIRTLPAPILVDDGAEYTEVIADAD